MRGHGNVYGSNEVFTWMTGYPFAVDFARGIAFYNPVRQPPLTSCGGVNAMPL